ncbi:helix-turn-helix domain-containing protein [Mycoplasmopsis anatis]|uniref:Site-specific DNA-methyltransferase (adenine-specific) n=1 Tax=Mycoplasmopsis anatis 1340 TaxID=1034808 RepID=F9QCM6_9BACT|nr:Dam family site-specific DNA-(adenine-N6)-methyltransferase [Mycoplasmopsis anatis]AWX69779.1 helix-turn-helix domain-containing protein [Mycoplasmopsis anatis]EGS29493.1 adenine-specific DNA methyltransferase [Mycoplasmopsis anatis 1340]VEU73807.1 adenine-specific DNA methyltransferase [Mycoplasmopsis anatis]
MIKTIQQNFGTNLKQIRNKSNLSQEDLAELSGIDRAQISRIEKGLINVTLETIVKLKNSLGVDFSQIMDIDADLKPKPFVKWAGGKTQILSKIKDFLPKKYNDYYEPFVGGGALFFELCPQKAYINDFNKELISAYKCFQNLTQLVKLKEELLKHESNHSEEYYYKIREMDKSDNYESLELYMKAARLIYLNKSCFNGLYRVNSKGFFNVPFGKKINVKTFDNENFEAIKLFFNKSKIEITSLDFEKALETAKNNDFVYLDPPYDIYPDKNGFVNYDKNGFGKDEQIRLRDCVINLTSKGVKVMISNHNTKFINEIYKDFNIHVISAKRIINSKADRRGEVEEVIITNFKDINE